MADATQELLLWPFRWLFLTYWHESCFQGSLVGQSTRTQRAPRLHALCFTEALLQCKRNGVSFFNPFATRTAQCPWRAVPLHGQDLLAASHQISKTPVSSDGGCLAAPMMLCLRHDTRLPTSFVSAVFAARHQIRVIALVRSLDVADAALGAYARQMKYARLRPVARRPEAIDRLLDRMLAERGSPLRISQVTPENQRALRSHGWPANFASLREAADRFAEIARAGSINGAASALGVPRTTLHHWYSEILGLAPPLVAPPGTTRPRPG